MKLWLGMGVVVIAGLIWSQGPTVLVHPTESGDTSQAATNSPSSATTQAVLTAQQVAKLATFRGAAVDGALRTDHRGQLVVDLQLRHWIDFYLSAQGEVALEELILTMQQQMQQLPQPGQAQALALLDNYLGYLTALANYDVDEARRLVQPEMNDLAARLAWQQRLRREWLEPNVVSAFFAAEESIDEYTLAAQQLRRQGADTNQLAALEQTLPAEIREMRQESRQLLTLQAAEAEFKQQGNTAELQQWRVQQYGTEAAQRLAKLDEQHHDWQQRLQAYQAYQQGSSLKQLSPHDRDNLLKTYRNQHFSSAEQKRLTAAIQLLATEN